MKKQTTKKIAIVTGASSGLGREFVKQISKSRALDEIWVIARRKDRLEEVRKLSKAALVAGVTLSLAASACTTEGDPWPDQLEGDVYYPEDTTQCQNTEIAPSDNEAISIDLEEM